MSFFIHFDGKYCEEYFHFNEEIKSVAIVVTFSELGLWFFWNLRYFSHWIINSSHQYAKNHFAKLLLFTEIDMSHNKCTLYQKFPTENVIWPFLPSADHTARVLNIFPKNFKNQKLIPNEQNNTQQRQLKFFNFMDWRWWMQLPHSTHI